MRISSSPYSAYRQPVPATANYGLLSVGAGPWDGTSPGHYTGDPGGTVLAINDPAAPDLLVVQGNGQTQLFVPGPSNANWGSVMMPGTLRVSQLVSYSTGSSITIPGAGPIVLKGGGSNGTGMLLVDGTGLPASAVALTVKAQNGASGDSIQLQNSAGTAIGGIDAIGVLYGLDVALFDQKITASTTLTMSSPHYIWVDASAGAVTVTLPASTGNPIRTYVIKKIDSTANAVTIAGNGADTIEGSATITLSAQWTFRAVTNTGAGIWYITGGSAL